MIRYLTCVRILGGVMEILLLQPGFLLLRLQNAFGIQIYAFMKGFPPRSGEDFQDGPHGPDLLALARRNMLRAAAISGVSFFGRTKIANSGD